MVSGRLFFFLVFSLLPVLHSAEGESRNNQRCFPFPCAQLGEVVFPFNNKSNPECGLYSLDNCEKNSSRKPRIQLVKQGRWYDVERISQALEIFINDSHLQDQINKKRCSVFKDLALPQSSVVSSVFTNNLTLYKCNRTSQYTMPVDVKPISCGGYKYYYLSDQTLPSLPLSCSKIQVPRSSSIGSTDLFGLLTAKFKLHVWETHDCFQCFTRGGECQIVGEGKFHCTKGKRGRKTWKLKVYLGVGFSVILVFVFVVLCYYRKRYVASKNISSERNPRSDLEGGSVCFGVPVFTYCELEKSTNNFDQARELGDGGFGTVYYGKLCDGREVAVKRLYQHNCRRVEQFINEIKLLTNLRHKNLVSLYGCTSRHSRELLLVYEFIPNGTVADHLHGEKADCSSLSWHIRMSIAIETASALSYLHASDIIHRDVKTNNILLDNNFCVKVADFGLSRLLPNDVTHVSTAPQGTLGYVDPEYHQCYQLTTKSDVYSFGVVLIELISSMKAVDITRHRQEINLANLAVNKIKKCKFRELIDPGLGFETDSEVQRMTIGVAMVAFQCLQQAKESRPTMEEVSEALKRIESGKNEVGKQSEAFGPERDAIRLLKNMCQPQSPNSEADNWLSISTSPTFSG